MIPSYIADCISDTEYRQRKAREKRQQQLDRIAAAEKPTTETLSPNDRLAIARSQKAADDSSKEYERQQARETQARDKERQTKTLQLFRQFWDAASPDERGRTALQYAYVRGFVPMTAGGFQNQAQVDQTMAALKDKTFMARHFPDRFGEWVKLMKETR
jgi:hypothetical protein